MRSERCIDTEFDKDVRSRVEAVRFRHAQRVHCGLSDSVIFLFEDKCDSVFGVDKSRESRDGR